MGDGYELNCKKCGFTREIYSGIGFGYPVICADILDKMKNGKFGKRFMELALKSEGAAIHYDREVFVCDYCGSFREDAVIDLCAPIGEPKVRTQPFFVGYDCAEDAVYVMSHEIGKDYSIARSKRHICGKCRHELRPAKKNEKLKCPECGGALKKCHSVRWD